MQEVKQPNKKPFIFYYLIALVAIMLINSLLVPQIVQRAVKEVDYNTFMQMTYDKQIDEVQVQDNQIVFTAKDDKTIYKTGLMDDPDRTQRLYDSGAKFSSEIVEEASPILSFLISWLLPLIIIIGFGQLMYRQMAKKAGGDSMMFGMGGMGKSNAKVYVKSSNGIKFTDVAGEDEAKENHALIPVEDTVALGSIEERQQAPQLRHEAFSVQRGTPPIRTVTICHR